MLLMWAIVPLKGYNFFYYQLSIWQFSYEQQSSWELIDVLSAAETEPTKEIS